MGTTLGKTLLLFLCSLTALCLGACNGGGSGSGDTVGGGGGPTGNGPASSTATADGVANAGSDQNVFESAMVTLDGSASSDSDGDQLTYQWKQTAGPDVTNGAGSLSGMYPTFMAPATPATLVFELRVDDGNGYGAADTVTVNVMGPPVTQLTFDPAANMPEDRTVAITRALLTYDIKKAFQTVLNSPDDAITLKIDGSIEVPLPIPDVPPGLFSGGTEVSKTFDLSVGQKNSTTYYQVSFARDKGISLGIGVPGLPKGTKISDTETASYETREVFRYASPTDAAQGVLDYLVLKGLWSELNKYQVLDIDTQDINGVADAIETYLSDQTGFDFSLTFTRSELNTLLTAAQATAATAQTAYDGAKTALDNANTALDTAQTTAAAAQTTVDDDQAAVNSAQNSYDTCLQNHTTAFCSPKLSILTAKKAVLKTDQAALTAANKTLSKAQTAAAQAQSDLDAAKASLDEAGQTVADYQDQLDALPPKVSIDLFTTVLHQLEDRIAFLNQSHEGSTDVISVALKGVAKADILGGIKASRTRSMMVMYDVKDKSITHTIKFNAVKSLEADVSKLVETPVDKGSLKDSNAVQYTFVFAWDPQTHKHYLPDAGTFTLSADLSGTLGKGPDILSRYVGAGITPTLAYSPGQGSTDFGPSATAIIDLSATMSLMDDYPTVTADDVIQAANSTFDSFDMDQLVATLSAVPLPLKVKFYRMAGVSSKLSGKSPDNLIGNAELTADWKDYGKTLDKSSMTVGDFVDGIFTHDGLVTNNVDPLIGVIQDAYPDLSATY